MKLSIREDEIFERWKSQLREQTPPIRNFVRDGIASETDYNSSALKVIYILKEGNMKEANADTEIDFDLRAYMRGGARAATWDNITRWTKGIFKNQETELRWSDYNHIHETDRLQVLKEIGSMNLKKNPGGHTALMNRVWEACVRDKKLLKEQYDLYSPDITICGGTFHPFKSEVLQNKAESLITTNGVEYFLNGKNKVVVNFVHPATRARSNILFNTLVPAIQEIKKRHL